jgi:N-methylhydantoinase A
VTDANLVLGRLNPSLFLGGELSLDVEASRRAIGDRIATPLGYEGEEGLIRIADGILSIATVVMAGAIRRVSVEHGLDPRDFVLFSYGGGGPLHGSALAHELSIPNLVIPPEPGNFSAIGMLLADARLDTSKTFTAVLDEGSVSDMAGLFAEMENEARVALAHDFGASEVSFEHHTEMRYRGQRHNIKVALDSLTDANAIRQCFERDYKRRYGHADAKAPVEVQALHLSAFARLRRPDIARLPRAAAAAGQGATRPVYFESAGGMVYTAIYARAALAPGFKADGPAVIEEYGSTTIIWPGDSFEIGAMGEIRIHCSGV